MKYFVVVTNGGVRVIIKKITAFLVRISLIPLNLIINTNENIS
jgi:hypothetical protein